MTLDARVARLEQRRRAVAADVAREQAARARELFAAAEGDEPVPDVAAIVAAWRRGWSVACRSHVLRLCDDGTLFDRYYPGVDLGYTTGEKRDPDLPVEREG